MSAVESDIGWAAFCTKDINALAQAIHKLNRQWWHDLVTGAPLMRNKGELLMLIVSEVAEAMEGARKNIPDSHLPKRPAEEVELADAVIRILDYAAGFGFDLQGAIAEKLEYNAHRQDHTAAARMGQHGKKF